jgi:hypothetical protein
LQRGERALQERLRWRVPTACGDQLGEPLAQARPQRQEQEVAVGQLDLDAARVAQHVARFARLSR